MRNEANGRRKLILAVLSVVRGRLMLSCCLAPLALHFSSHIIHHVLTWSVRGEVRVHLTSFLLYE